MKFTHVNTGHGSFLRESHNIVCLISNGHTLFGVSFISSCRSSITFWKTGCRRGWNSEIVGPASTAGQWSRWVFPTSGTCFNKETFCFKLAHYERLHASHIRRYILFAIHVIMCNFSNKCSSSRTMAWLTRRTLDLAKRRHRDRLLHSSKLIWRYIKLT